MFIIFSIQNTFFVNSVKANLSVSGQMYLLSLFSLSFYFHFFETFILFIVLTNLLRDHICYNLLLNFIFYSILKNLSFGRKFQISLTLDFLLSAALQIRFAESEPKTETESYLQLDVKYNPEYLFSAKLCIS